MKIVIAPDSFKDSLTAKQAAEIIFNAFAKVAKNNNYLIIPISDGGEGLVSTLTNQLEKFRVIGPLGEAVTGEVGFKNNKKTAIIEMASASGIEKVPHAKRDPHLTTTYGVGQLILKALDANSKKIIIGMGGSATNDLGLGALTALGVKFFNQAGKAVGVFGKDLLEVRHLDISSLDKRLAQREIIIACDVKNSLLGKAGATFVYGPQKGLKTIAELNRFEDAFSRVSNLLENVFSKEATKVAGTGAAGGLAYALFLASKGIIKQGFDVVDEELKLKEKLINTDILITGEGRIDKQTFEGKAPFSIGKAVLDVSPNVLIYSFAGSVEKDLTQTVFKEIIPLQNKNESLESSLRNAQQRLYEKALQLALKLFNRQ